MKQKIAVVLFFLLPAYLMASTLTGTLTGTLLVSGDADIFGAGHASLPPVPDNAWIPGLSSGAGSLPLSVSFPAGANQILTFSSVTGLVYACGTTDPNEPANGPDGRVDLYSWIGGTNIDSLEGIAGIQYTGQRMFLVGVFLDGSEPVDPAPPRLTFTSPNDVAEFSPGLRQVFFIGDGRMADGAQQIFDVPAGATRLFLGFADANTFAGPPGYYSDDSGLITANFDITGVAVPEPGSVALVLIGLGLLAGHSFRRRSS